MKKFILTLALIAAVAVSTFAATKSVSGKVTAIDGSKVTIAVQGDSADWVKKNGFVKFKGGTGKIVEVSAPDIKAVTFVFTTKKASALKVDEVVTFDKGLSVAGC